MPLPPLACGHRQLQVCFQVASIPFTWLLMRRDPDSGITRNACTSSTGGNCIYCGIRRLYSEEPANSLQ